MKLIKTIVLGCIFCLLGACNEKELPIPKKYKRPAKILAVVAEDQEDMREFAGKVSAADVSALSFRIGGEIADLPVRNGQEINKGELIAKLDDSDAQNALKNAEAQYELAIAEHLRKKSLYERRVISQSSYDIAFTQLVSATTALDQAKDNLSYTIIKAPFDGVIGKVNVENHQVISPDQIVATIQGRNNIEITIQLPESIVANIRPAEEILDYQPQAWFTSMPEKSYAISYKESAAQANSGSQTYDVTFTLESPGELSLLTGMSATVAIDIARIIRNQNKARFILPLSAVSKIDGDDLTYVWQFDVNTETVRKTSVVPGRITDHGIEILSGISEGELIVTAGVSQLHDGMAVRPLVKERGL